MTTIENAKLSEAEELANLNQLFAKRYTDHDAEYIQMAKPRSQIPPIVDDWGQDRNNHRNQRPYHSNNRYHSNDRYHHQQHRNDSRDNRSRWDRSRSPLHHQNKRR